MRCTVYGLRSTASDEIRYVGQTTNLPRRHDDHLKGAKKRFGAKAVGDWIRSEWGAGNGILAVALKRDATWDKDEAEVIAAQLRTGARLLNKRPGNCAGDLLKRRAKAGRRAVRKFCDASRDVLSPYGMAAHRVSINGRSPLTADEN